MPRQRIVVNVRTGERKLVDYTPQEEAEADVDFANDLAIQAAHEDQRKDITKADKMLKAFALWVGQQMGKTPAQMRDEIRAIYNSL